jgi:hypothetical protein
VSPSLPQQNGDARRRFGELEIRAEQRATELVYELGVTAR